MYFPITDVTVNPFLLALIGFAVGILGGFFGVGGGFIAGPMMYLLGVPMNFVVGTDLAHMTGKSIVGMRRHWALGHVDVRLGVLMVLGTVPGVEAGARVIEYLKANGSIDLILGSIYIMVLLLISAFTAWESWLALKMPKTDQAQARDSLAFTALSQRMQRLRLPPVISFPHSGIAEISAWVVLGLGFLSGLLAGMLGVGGGFIRMPLLVYVVGVPTHVAVGTDLFEIVISAGYGTLTHSFKGNVDILMALVMHTGAAVGAQIGAVATTYFAGPRIRLAFSSLPLLGAALMLYRLLTGGSV
ncbi:MAG: sulfite exporter TauE/SafE family protein [Thermoflexales bacterium]|nr:sulfite exporter TauE/SafE family protein [Thermoflexales bacterium]